jgi:hypothetical protein
MRQHFRPYTLVLNTNDITTALTPTLKDSGGVPLLCNYVSLTLSGTGGSHVRMSANFPGLTTPQSNFKTPANSINDSDGSGVPSVYTTPGGEAATLVLSDADRVSSVSIQGDAADAVTAIITYGQISIGNNIRDQDRPVGS